MVKLLTNSVNSSSNPPTLPKKSKKFPHFREYDSGSSKRRQQNPNICPQKYPNPLKIINNLKKYNFLDRKNKK